MPRSKKWPLKDYWMNSPENPVVCFQVIRRTHFKGEATYKKQTIFLSKEQNTLGYLEFTGPNYTFWDEYIAVWKIKQSPSRT